MRVIKAKSAGFCLGVSLALQALDKEMLAQQEKMQPEGRLIMLGPIIHNPLVMQEYQGKGVVCIDTPALVRAGDRVVIRAHGVPKETEEALVRSGALIVDATCPKVKKAQLAIAREQTRLGATLLLFGEADHPEVRGLVSYANHKAVVFNTVAELAAMPLEPKDNFFLAAQTTQERAAFLAARDVISQKLGYLVPMLDTICDATRKRQEEAIALSRQVEAMVVVGGLNSGNTRRLAEVAKAQGIQAFHIEKAADLDLAKLASFQVIGLTAGASTPTSHIAAVQACLEKV